MSAQKKHIVIDARMRRTSTGRYVDQLVEHLQDVDNYHRYTVLVQPDDNWKMHAHNFHTLPCPFPQFSLNPLNDIRFALQLYRLKPDLVHFSMTQQPLLYFGTIVTTTHDLTMFHFVRRVTNQRGPYWLKIRLYKLLMWWSHWKSKYIIVPTHTTAKEVGEFQPSTKQKLVVTYESVAVPPAVKARKPEGVGKEFIMYVGTAFPHKNLPVLLDAFDIIHKKRPELQLVLVGKTEKHYRELKYQAEQHSWAANILFTGFLPDEEVRWLYKHTECYVFTSLSEGFGLPPLDAMANGAPVVSSDASVMPEVYGDAAHYCNPRNPEDIAKKILEVMDGPKLRARLVKAGKNQVKKYSWTKMAKETLTTYKAALRD